MWEVPRARRTQGVAVRLIVFAVGAASLGTEIAAARLLAPYFGASTIVWANTIATVLVALACGYAIGGRLADRRPDLAGLCRLVVVASLLLALVPIVSDPFLRLSVRALGALSLGGLLGSLAAVLVLIAVPVLLLGAVSPYANRLTLRDVGETGRVTGRLYALSTAGSLAGTFLAALLLIPTVGTHRTFLIFALVLALVAMPWLSTRLGLVVPAVLAALLLVEPGQVGATGTGGRVIATRETPYQYARVVQLAGGERRLELNEGVAVHSDLQPGSYLTGGYWDDFLVLPFAGGSKHPPRRIAILGNAAGTTARAEGRYFPRTRVDAVELDGALTTLGRRYFDLHGPRLHVYTADARPWLAASRARYGAVFVDAYRQPYIPFYLTTHEFFAEIRRHLEPGGLVVVNVGHAPGSDALERVVSATMRSAFGFVLRDRFDDTNSLVVASEGRLSGESVQRAARGLPAALSAVAGSVAGRIGPALRGGAVYYDDRAPVEWLTDLSLLRYATGHR
ncbi:MAG: fused MFS/spermidine synthase [Actinobacteria bacterium]|nr:fused MFS/spermidine synthase [Actinomycetota bacterium]